MMVVRDGSVFVRQMTLRADPVPRSAKLSGVGLVAITAGDSGREHSALLERAVIVDLLAHLAVGFVEPAGKRRDHMRVGKPMPRHPVLGKCAAARMAQAASLDLLAE